jgi:hypothetical protein
VLHRVTGDSRREIDALIGELQTLRERLEPDSKRLQSDISEYASLSQQVMQLTRSSPKAYASFPTFSSPA